jgi:hypothetical protein
MLKKATFRIDQNGQPAEKMYPDGHGLYLRVGPTGSKSWVLRYRFGGKRHHLGLGPLEAGSGRGYTLQEARDRAAEQRRLLRNGINPLKARRDAAIEQALTKVATKTFRECAEQYIAEHEAGWRGPKEAPQWRASLRDHAYPKIGDMVVADIDTAAVLRVLKPMWGTKTQTADRVRSRIQKIWGWAKIEGYCTGDNPAQWTGHLQTHLATVAKVAKVEAPVALPYVELPGFMVGGQLTRPRPGRWNS